VAPIKIARSSEPALRTAATEPAVPDGSGEELDKFGSESGPPRMRPPSHSTKPAVVPKWREYHIATVAKWIVVVAVSAVTAATGVWLYQRRAANLPTNGSMTIETAPSGAEVFIAGRSFGRTPLAVSLPPAAYDVELAAAGVRRALKVTLLSGTSVFQHVELGADSPARVVRPGTGALRVQTEPSRLSVSVDGVPRGLSPLTIEALQPGEHQVVVRGDRRVFRRTVSVQAGETLSLVISSFDAGAVTAGAVTAGWLTVASSIPVQLRKEGKLIGTSDTERLMLPSGDHEIEILNEALGFRAVRKINLPAGKTTVIKVDPPNGTLSVNALPWAEVWIDGERVGDTPLANLARTIGSHEVVFRHPELGERRETVVVTLRQPARLGVDLRRK